MSLIHLDWDFCNLISLVTCSKGRLNIATMKKYLAFSVSLECHVLSLEYTKQLCPLHYEKIKLCVLFTLIVFHLLCN